MGVGGRGWRMGVGWCILNGRIAEVLEAKALDEAGVCWAVAAGAAEVGRSRREAGGAAAAQGRGQAADGGARGERWTPGVPPCEGWCRPPE